MQASEAAGETQTRLEHLLSRHIAQEQSRQPGSSSGALDSRVEEEAGEEGRGTGELRDKTEEDVSCGPGGVVGLGGMDSRKGQLCVKLLYLMMRDLLERAVGVFAERSDSYSDINDLVLLLRA